MFENFILEVAKPHRKCFIFLVLLLFFFFLIGFSLILLLISSQSSDFDLSTAQKIQNFHSLLFLNLMKLVSLFGSGFYLGILFLLILFWLWRRGSREEAWFLPLVFVAPVVSEASKIIIARPRPMAGLVSVHGTFPGFSFPSGHVLFYTLFFGFVAFLAISLPKVHPVARWIIAVLSIGMVVLIGISRIYLGAHWPTDVIAGYLAGLALLEIMITLYLKDVYLPKVRNKQKQANNNREDRNQ